MLACEATRKISAIFSQLSLALHRENQTLRAKVGKLEKELKTTSENFENAKTWKENVLTGCPVLFEESGLIFALRPFGKLAKNPDTLKVGAPELSLPPVVQNGCDNGGFHLKSQHKMSP